MSSEVVLVWQKMISTSYKAITLYEPKRAIVLFNSSDLLYSFFFSVIMDVAIVVTDIVLHIERRLD